MSVTLLDYPVDVLTRIVSFLNLEGTCSCWRVSKTVQNIILTVANQTQADFDLDGIDVEYNCDSLKSLLYLKLKVKKFTMDPRFFTSLKEATAEPFLEKPKDVMALWAFGRDSYVQMMTLVVFDFTTKKLTGPDLSLALHATVSNEESEVEDTDPAKAELIDSIFLHPNADQLTANALESALETAIADSDPALVEKVLNHPNAKAINESDLLKHLDSAKTFGDCELFNRLEEHLIMRGVIDCTRPRKRRRKGQ